MRLSQKKGPAVKLGPDYQGANMSKIAVFATLFAAAAMTGCVSEKATLTNTAGQQVHCDNLGFGILGAPVAMASHADCMKKAHAAGYSEMPVAQPAK